MHPDQGARKIHKTMTKVIQFIVVVSFLIIIYRKKIKSYIQAKKAVKLSDITSTTDGNVPTACAGSRSGVVAATTDQISALSVNPYHDFIVVDLTENLMDAFDIESKLTSRLALAETKLREAGNIYKVDFLTIGTALIVVITYGIQQ